MKHIQAIKAIFSCVDIPAERHRASNSLSLIRTVNQESKNAYRLLSVQSETIKDLLVDIQAKMYPDRFTDNSTVAMQEEERVLTEESKNLDRALEFIGEMISETDRKIKQHANSSISNALEHQNINYRGM